MAARIQKRGGTMGAAGAEADGDGAREDGAEAEAMSAGQRFQSGSAGLAGRPDDEVVTLVNVALGNVQVRVPDPGFKSDRGTREKLVTVLAFGTVDLPVRYAREALLRQERRPNGPARANVRLVLQAPAGDCGGRDFFRTDPERGFSRERWRTCPYSNCKTCGSKPWSIWQIQHFIATTGSDAAKEYVIQEVDPREAVMVWGAESVRRAREAKARRMGLQQAKHRHIPVH